MKQKKVTIQLKEDDGLVEMEVGGEIIDFYKKETGHSKVTRKGLSRFFNHLIELHNSFLL